MAKKLTFLIILLFLIVLPIGYSITLDTSLYTLPKFTHELDKGTASVVFDVKSTLDSENGLFELQMCKPGECGFPLQTIITQKSACDPNKPYQSSIAYQFVNEIGKTQRITITNTGIPDGDYYPILVHVDTCCTTGSCNDKQPFGWGYPLTQGKITFKKSSCAQVITPACNPTTKEIKNYNTPCDVPSEWTTELTQCATDKVGLELTDFELSNLKRITNFEQFSAGDKTWIFLKNAPVYSVTLKNTGTQNGKGTVEAYYVSKENNPFFSNKLTELSNRNSLLPLQSVSLIKSGETCKKDIGFSYEFGNILAGESKTIYMQPTKPTSCSNDASKCKLGGKDNYNSNDEYLLVVNVVDDCTNGNSYDEIGGCINFGSGICDKISDSDANNTPKDETARQITIKREDIKHTPTKDLSRSLCTTKDVCQSNAICEPMQALIEDDFITQSDASDFIEAHKSDLSTISGSVGGIAGILASTKGLIVGGKTLIPALCTATGVTLLTYPVCLAAVTLTGGYAFSKVGDSVAELFKGIASKDTQSVGYCVPKEETTSGGFTKFIDSIGKGVNDFFGGKSKTKLTDTNMGYIIFGVFIFFIFLSFTRR